MATPISSIVGIAVGAQDYTRLGRLAIQERTTISNIVELALSVYLSVLCDGAIADQIHEDRHGALKSAASPW